MEGAVLSGKLTAQAIQEDLTSNRFPALATPDINVASPTSIPS
jgi:15-cis-phytoene desaturase